MTSLCIRKCSQTGMLMTGLVLSLKFFQSTPFEQLFFKLQAVFMVFILFFLFLYVANTLIERQRINRVVLYFLFLMAIVPFYSALMALLQFAQPLIYGILTERFWLLVGFGIWMYYMIINGKITFSTVESVFVFMAWTSLVIFCFIILIYKLGHLHGVLEGSGLVSLTEVRGVRFKFQVYFITFGSIYYFTQYALYKNRKHLIMLLAFLGYVFFIVQGRTYILALVSTFLLYYWLNYSPSRLLGAAIKLGFFCCVFLVILQFVFPQYLDRMSYLFVQMFEVLVGKESQDISANSRLLQARIVLEYLTNHWTAIWMGAGKVSQQWNDGFISIFGYFHPSDIGALGGLFLYGIIGLIIVFIIPMGLCFKILKRTVEKENVFIISLKYLLVFSFVRAIQGSFYFGVVQYTLPLFVLMAYTELQEKRDVT